MLNLTKHNKNLSYDDKRAIEALKREMIREQYNLCYVCQKPFNSNRLPEMSHILARSKTNIKKYGYEVINHRLNMKICCSKHNSKVMINSSKTELVKEHLKPIHEDLINQGYSI